MLQLFSSFSKIFSNISVLLVGGFITKLVVSLGVSIVSYSFLSDLFDYLAEYVKNSAFQIPKMTLSLLEISGFADALEMVFSAIMFVFMFNSTTKVFKLMGK